MKLSLSVIQSKRSALGAYPKGQFSTPDKVVEMSFAGRVALVTGGSKGIGRAVAQQLAAKGASVAINYSSDSAAAEELVSSIGSEKALALKADAGDVKALDDLVKQTVDKFGKIDILIPNAGILPMKDLEGTTEEDFDKTYAINVKGPYFLAQVSPGATNTLEAKMATSS